MVSSQKVLTPKCTPVKKVLTQSAHLPSALSKVLTYSEHLDVGQGQIYQPTVTCLIVCFLAVLSPTLPYTRARSPYPS